ncbi:sensor histidine kinase [Dakarella massiliensis]|uniref:sensor histidine kinase n=1 Tax=Dakarella massiliensis TaxID=1506471 RepID=UPI001651DA29|nr:PhnD/SsuA/transferrin family substrate-binding protein [Dakarella massiliensis]
MPEERPDILATFAWLKKKLPQYQIEIRNYTIPGLEYAIRHGEVDFFLETAGFYRRVYVQGLRDIATMITREAPNPSEAVGSLILVPYDSPYKSIEDLKGKRAAVSWIEAFSGVYIPEGELAARGLSPDHYFHYVEAGSPMTNLLAAVQRGDADFALARTCTFEQLEKTTPEYAKQFRAVSLKKPDAVFHCRTSTDLYPYWTFISTQTATAPVSRAVTVALLTMPETSHGVAWGVVSDFARVDGLFRTLKAGPYAYLRVESVGDFVRKYRPPILFCVLLIFLLIFHSWRSGKLVEERTAELEKSRLAEEAATRRKLEAEKKLETFERVSVIGAISSLITHELNGPLSTISNCCGTLERLFERTPPAPVVTRMEALIEKQSWRSSEIIERVRGYAKNRNGELVPVNFSASLERVASMRRLAHPDISITLSLPEKPLFAAWDELEMELVANNLIKNAAEACASNPAPRVAVTLGENAGFAVLSVEDNGSGNKSDADTPLTPTPLHSTKGNGLGLGLLIVKTLVEKISGRLELSRSGGITLARVTIPLEEAKGASSEACAATAPQSKDKASPS